MKKFFLIWSLLVPFSVQAQDIPKTVNSSQKITQAKQSQKAAEPKILIQESPQKTEEQNIANTPIAASPDAKIPYQLKSQAIFNNQVIVSIPSTFARAPQELIRSNYPDENNLPKIVLTDKTLRPLLSFNITQNTGDRDDIIHFMRDIKNDLRSRFPAARFIRTDVIRNHTLAIIEVVLPNKDGKNMYNLMAFRYVGTQFFFMNFSAPEEDMPLWQDTAKEMGENIKVNYTPEP